MTAVDLFAGPGGWDVAAADLWVDTVGLDTSVDACDTAKAAGHVRERADVTTVDPRDFLGFPGLIASPPCQGFSIAGKGRGRADAQLLLEGIADVHTGADVDALIGRLHADMTDDRSLLVLEPLRWALHIRPEWVALEQVPGVLPIWQACAGVLAQQGYAVDTGYLQAEAYGVPQTRKRAVLVARLHGPARLPVPTHSRYHSRRPDTLDPDVLPWVSMAEALGWGMTVRPYPSVAPGTAAGGTDPQALGGSGARRLVTAAREAGEWIDQPQDHPRALRQSARGRATVRAMDEPAPTITGSRDYGERVWQFAGAGRTSVDSKGTAAWVPRFRDQSGSPFDPEWPTKRPATAVAGRGLVQNPGETSNRFNTSTKSRNDGVRVTVQEAAALQTFPDGYPWAGSLTSQFQQVGDAIPPTLARAILAEVMP